MPLGEDLLVVALTDACVAELWAKLNINTRELSFREVKAEVVSYIEPRVNASSRPVSVDIGN